MTHLITNKYRLKGMTHQDFLQFGKDEIHYVRPVKVDKLELYGLFNANGERLNVYQSEKDAKQAAWINDIIPISVH